MSDLRPDTPSVVERTKPVEAGAAVVGLHFLGSTAAFVLAEEALLLVPPQGDSRRMVVHGGGILAAASDGVRTITGGDDGKVMATDSSGTSNLIASDAKRRWVDHVAIGPGGALAWSVGKQAFVRDGKGLEHSHEALSTVGGLAFMPKGFRLAIAHYNGATLWFPNAKAAPETLEWKGSHRSVTVSPDGRFLITSMQEPTLHGWRIVDRKDLRMSGYGARVNSLDWSADGKWLATAGSTQLILWPFQSKDGPMGKTPQLWAPMEALVQVVACHPRESIVAVGYADGLILLVRTDDGAEILAKKPGDAPVTALAWSADGKLLAFATETGEAGIVDLR
jgi:WD40 repeat protein